MRLCALLLHAALLALLAVALRAAKPRDRAARPRPCADLPEEVLEQMFGRLSVGVQRAFHHTLQLEAGEPSCPAAGRAPPGPGATRVPVNLLSLSPWAYRLSHDPARYPRYIPEAYCLCRGCLTGPGGRESLRYRSTPVYLPSVILKRTGSCVGGRHSYLEHYVSVPVGCTCMPLLERDAGHGGNRSVGRANPKNRKGISNKTLWSATEKDWS